MAGKTMKSFRLHPQTIFELETISNATGISQADTIARLTASLYAVLDMGEASFLSVVGKQYLQAQDIKRKEA